MWSTLAPLSYSTGCVGNLFISCMEKNQLELPISNSHKTRVSAYLEPSEIITQ